MKLSVAWPVAIKYSGDDELVFVKNESAWLADSSLSTYAYDADDVLVDTNGALYDLDYDANTRLTRVVAQQKNVSIDQLEGWVKNHLVLLNQCCSSKLTLSSITEGLELIEQLTD